MKGYVCSYTYIYVHTHTYTHTHTGIEVSSRHMIVPHSGLGAFDTLTGRPCATTLTILSIAAKGTDPSKLKRYFECRQVAQFHRKHEHRFHGFV
jgi:hypothetical protein